MPLYLDDFDSIMQLQYLGCMIVCEGVLGLYERERAREREQERERERERERENVCVCVCAHTHALDIDRNFKFNLHTERLMRMSLNNCLMK